MIQSDKLTRNRTQITMRSFDMFRVSRFELLAMKLSNQIGTIEGRLGQEMGVETNLGKATIWLVGASMAVLSLALAAIGVSTAVKSDPWYLTTLVPMLWITFIIVGTLGLGIGLSYIVMLLKRHLVPLVIHDNIRCIYIGRANEFQVTCWFDDNSTRETFKLRCVASFGAMSVPVDGLTKIGGTYFNGQNLTSGARGSIMAEFVKKGLMLDDPKEARIEIRIKPEGALWKTVTKYRETPVQVTN